MSTSEKNQGVTKHASNERKNDIIEAHFFRIWRRWRKTQQLLVNTQIVHTRPRFTLNSGLLSNWHLDIGALAAVVDHKSCFTPIFCESTAKKSIAVAGEWGISN